LGWLVGALGASLSQEARGPGAAMKWHSSGSPDPHDRPRAGRYDR
jgi:hypothetical protein